VSQTPERRMFLAWKSRRKHYDYRHGEGASPLMQVARRFGVPIRVVRDAIEAQRGTDPVAVSRAQRQGRHHA
jgi:predicted transcriptional regulator